MPTISTSSQFLDSVRKSGLVEAKHLDAWLRDSRDVGPTSDPRHVAQGLERAGLLTAFQAKMLLQGKSKNFVISGKYKLLDLLGSGGASKVFLCEHVRLNRKVALKVLPAEMMRDQTLVQRFYREARALASLDHPNIVHAFDMESNDQMHFLVMEYVEGVNLEVMVRRQGPLGLNQAASYIAQAAEGLEHAHRAGWVHRDVKPANLLVDAAGTVKLLDLGLVRLFEDESDPMTKFDARGILGTADYLSPEQAVNSHDVDIRTDIYSLGATFYFLLAGRAPFDGASTSQKILGHRTRPPQPIQDVRPDVPAELAEVLDKMMAKNRALRYQTPAEVADALQPWARVPQPAAPTQRQGPKLLAILWSWLGTVRKRVSKAG